MSSIPATRFIDSAIPAAKNHHSGHEFRNCGSNSASSAIKFGHSGINSGILAAVPPFGSNSNNSSTKTINPATNSGNWAANQPPGKNNRPASTLQVPWRLKHSTVTWRTGSKGHRPACTAALLRRPKEITGDLKGQPQSSTFKEVIF